MFRILPLVLLDDDAFDAYLSDDEDNNNDAQQVIVIEDEGGGGNRCTMDKKPCHTNLNHYLEVLDGIDGHQKKRCRERVTNDNDNYNDNDMNENNVAMENHLRTRRWILIVVSFLPFLFSSITLVVMVLSGGHHRTSMTTKSEMLSTFQFDELGFVHEDIFIPP
jgi:hypothetical protein